LISRGLRQPAGAALTPLPSARDAFRLLQLQYETMLPGLQRYGPIFPDVAGRIKGSERVRWNFNRVRYGIFRFGPAGHNRTVGRAVLYCRIVKAFGENGFQQDVLKPRL